MKILNLCDFYELLQNKAIPLTDVISECNAKVVLAESCTGGLVSALLTTVPGISQYHCGSFVTYRPSSKNKWLGISKEIIQNYTCESEQMAREMAFSSLSRTPEAEYSLAVVGHLSSPDSVDDGCYWIGMANRSTMNTADPHLTYAFHGKCKQADRVARQFEISFRVLEIFKEHLQKYGKSK